MVGGLSIELIQAAAGAIDPVFLNSPQFELDPLNDQLGMRLVAKVETLNPIRSFKGRGADFFAGGLSSAGTVADGRRLVCASAGNFGQGLAYAARKHGLSLTVFAAETANELKLERMRQLGAEVILQGADFDAAKVAAASYAEQAGARFVEDGREPEIAAGAGTIALELTRYPVPFDTVLIPLGNGALLNGVGSWFKAQSPRTQVIGISASGASAMERSWRSGSVQTTDRVETIADGIAIRVPVPEALETMRHTVDEIWLVEDETMMAAMRLAHTLFGLVVEPAGVAGLAAAMTYRERFAGQLVATPLCGGNVTEAQFKQWF